MVKLGDIARTLGHIGTEGVKLGWKGIKASGIGEAAKWWTKQGVDNVVARSYFAPFPMNRIYDEGLDKFLADEKAKGREYGQVPVHVETPVWGSKLSPTKYKRLISVATWSKLRGKYLVDEDGNHVQDKSGNKIFALGVVPAVYITAKYGGTRGNQEYDAVALIPKIPTPPAYRAAYSGPVIRSP